MSSSMFVPTDMKEQRTQKVLLGRLEKMMTMVKLSSCTISILAAAVVFFILFDDDDDFMGLSMIVFTAALGILSIIMAAGMYPPSLVMSRPIDVPTTSSVVSPVVRNPMYDPSVGSHSQRKSSTSRSIRRSSVIIGAIEPPPNHRPSLKMVSLDDALGTIDVRVRAGDPGDQVVDLIRKSVVGNSATLLGPFGTRLITYMDYTASGRNLSFIEDYIRDVVTPLYANTHTETSYTGLQTTHFREEARTMIADSLGVSLEEYAVLFTGTGSTAAINKLVNVMGLWIPEQWKPRLNSTLQEDERPVVIVGPYEHHSNEVMWRETIATVVTVDEGKDGHPDQDQIRALMERYKSRPLKIGSFSAGSNVSGLVPPIEDITRLLHSGGFLSFWDFAGSGAYIHVDFTPNDKAPETQIDAGYFSTHKYIGGPGASGLLVARRSLFRNQIPTVPGGGTVAMVSQRDVIYETDPELSEDAGTPGIIQAIRAGLAFHVKKMVGTKNAEALQHRYALRAIEAWERNPNIELMAGDRAGYKGRRVSIISFRMRYPHNGSSLLLHHHFIVQLLNDVYGIQGRGGCSCAAPYGERLAAEWARVSDTLKMMSNELNNQHCVKLGWARINFNYFLDDAAVDFAIAAVLQIANDGWKLLPQYQVDVHSGQFYHREFQHTDNIRLLNEAHYDQESGKFKYKMTASSTDDPTSYIVSAQQLYRDAETVARGLAPEIFSDLGDFYEGIPLVPVAEAARFFVLPSQAAQDLGVLAPPRFDASKRNKRLSALHADGVLAAAEGMRNQTGRRMSSLAGFSGGGLGHDKGSKRVSVLDLAEAVQRDVTLTKINKRGSMLRQRPRG